MATSRPRFRRAQHIPAELRQRENVRRRIACEPAPHESERMVVRRRLDHPPAAAEQQIYEKTTEQDHGEAAPAERGERAEYGAEAEIADDGRTQRETRDGCNEGAYTHAPGSYSERRLPQGGMSPKRANVPLISRARLFDSLGFDILVQDTCTSCRDPP